MAEAKNNKGKTPTKTTASRSKKNVGTKAKQVTNKTVKKENPPVIMENAININGKSLVLGILIAALILMVTIVKLSGNLIHGNNSKSYLITHKIGVLKVDENNINDITSSKEAFVFVTSLNNDEEYDLEKDLANIIKKDNLKDKFYVYVKDDNSSLNNSLQLTEEMKTPTILYFKDGQLVDYIKRQDELMMTSADFAQLLDIYEITK